MRFRLRTLMIVLAVVPPVLGGLAVWIGSGEAVGLLQVVVNEFLAWQRKG